MKLIISFTTYPRDGKVTYGLLERTFKTLIEDQDLSNINIKILVVGDDYENLDELKPIFSAYDTEFYNININDALRNKDIPYEVKWKQAVQRSKIFILEKSLELGYDYILMSADDEIYLNKKIETGIKYINDYNEPDLVFNLGLHCDSTVIPKNKYIFSAPSQYHCISSGILYKLKNVEFIKFILEYRKKRWTTLKKIMEGQCQDNRCYQIIRPEDAELWLYLKPFFQNKRFTSILIPIVLIHHEIEGTLKKYIT